MKVLLVNPPNTLAGVLGRAKSFVASFEPLGLLYIASVLEKEGVRVEVVDAYIRSLTLKGLEEVIAQRQLDVIGISCLTSNAALVYAWGKRLKEKFPSLKIVLGNLHASIFAEAFLQNKVCDFVVHNEGEYVMRDLVRELSGSKNFAKIEGLSWWNGSRAIHNEARGTIEDLDEIPMPARHLVPMDRYSVPTVSNYLYVPKRKDKFRSMFTSRGCVYQCSFCVVHQERQYRYWSTNRVIAEMEELIGQYQAEYIFIHDSLFTVKRTRVIEICNEIIKRKLRIKWGCEGHINHVDPVLLRKMREAGCYDIAFGIESGAQELLDNVHKKTNINKVREAVKMAKSAGLKVSGLFMLGLPGERKELSLQTIRFALELPLDFAQFNITVPYPGSELYNDLLRNNKIDNGLRADGSIDLAVWQRYSAHPSFSHKPPIYVPDGMDAKELEYLQKLALRKFFLRPSHIIFEMRRMRQGSLRNLLQGFKIIFGK